jgi:5-methylcytosine-specific restriction protein A
MTTTTYFHGTDLIWRGKTNSHMRQPTIQRMTSPGAEVHVFWRAEERDPFTYAGLGKAVEVSDETPVKVRWRFSEPKS